MPIVLADARHGDGGAEKVLCRQGAVAVDLPCDVENLAVLCENEELPSRIDVVAFVKYELFSPYSKGEKGLHDPFVETFADELPYAKHSVVLRVGGDRNANATGNWVRVYRLCVNGTPVAPGNLL